MYNKYVTFEQLSEYDHNIDNDPYIDDLIKKNPTIREVCRAGLFLCSALEDLDCPQSLILRIQWTAGKLSYRNDPWEVHASILEKYKNNTLVLEEDPEDLHQLIN